MFEIQFHPADIRKPVRYFFLSRAGARWLTAATIIFAIIVIAGLVLAPFGLQGLLLTSEQNRLAHLNQLHHEVLSRKVVSLDSLTKRTEQMKALQRQISLVLGTDEEETAQEGTPLPPPFVVQQPDAHRALDLSVTLSTQSNRLLKMADEITAFAEEHKTLIQTVPSICPIAAGEFVLTSPFGERISPFTNGRDFHAGLDLAAREGTPVMAAGDGRIIFAGRFPPSAKCPLVAIRQCRRHSPREQLPFDLCPFGENLGQTRSRCQAGAYHWNRRQFRMVDVTPTSTMKCEPFAKGWMSRCRWIPGFTSSITNGRATRPC